MTGSDRGQAFTLEGFVGSLLILSAIVFALQAVAVEPTTTGGTDPAIRNQLEREANDVLVTTQTTGESDLTHLVRNFDPVNGTFHGAVNPNVGYGTRQPPGVFGALLGRTFEQRSRTYNVVLEYRNCANCTVGTKHTRMVYRGEPGPAAVTATYTVTLYDNMTFTRYVNGTPRPVSSRTELWEYDTNATNNEDGYFPIPDASPGPVYNVVEVKLTVW